MLDVCLLLEGTYPYIAGGVSTWVHQLVSAMKDIRFGIVYIAPNPDPTRQIKFTLPDNIIYLKEIYLHDYNLEGFAQRRPKKKDYELVEKVYHDVIHERFDDFTQFARLFRGDTPCFDTPRIFSSIEIWEMLVRFYDTLRDDISFLDFFWTWRGTHLPLAQILAADLPPAQVYHAISTGYAGLLGCIAKATTRSKFFLTEHGIYTHERMLEISQANWIYERDTTNFHVKRDLTFFKRWWVALFQVISRMCYHYADRIFTLYEGNKLRQIIEGAVAEKITVIPNGIAIHDYENLEIKSHDNPCIGLIGRVVNIKDIKTFIHAARIILEKIPNAQFYIIGPTDEEEDYVEECRALIGALSLEDKFKFTGRIKIKDALQMLDLVVLTSISEAQPYVILEANIVGLPIVATDVGACREMVEGQNPQDRALGPSGIITEVANPANTAQAIINLLSDKQTYQKMSLTGKLRVKKYYDQADLLSKYLNVYEQNM